MHAFTLHLSTRFWKSIDYNLSELCAIGVRAIFLHDSDGAELVGLRFRMSRLALGSLCCPYNSMNLIMIRGYLGKERRLLCRPNSGVNCKCVLIAISFVNGARRHTQSAGMATEETSNPDRADSELRNSVYPALPVSFGGDTKSCRSLLSGVYARGSKISHTKCVTCRGLHNSEITTHALAIGCLEYTQCEDVADSYRRPGRRSTPWRCA